MTHFNPADSKPAAWAQPIFDDLRELLITIHRLKFAATRCFQEDDAVTREVEGIWVGAKQLAENLKQVSRTQAADRCLNQSGCP